MRSTLFVLLTAFVACVSCFHATPLQPAVRAAATPAAAAVQVCDMSSPNAAAARLCAALCTALSCGSAPSACSALCARAYALVSRSFVSDRRSVGAFR